MRTPAVMRTSAFAVTVCAVVLAAGCNTSSSTAPPSTTATSRTTPASTAPPAPSTTAPATIAGLTLTGPDVSTLDATLRPNPAKTPGAVFPNVTAAQVCQTGYSASVRDVPTSEKDQVYASYRITSHSTGMYEVDHLVSLELGGSNDIGNLWPEPYDPAGGAHDKDRVENYLHRMVCSGAVTLTDAQTAIRDWTRVVVGPVTAPAGAQTVPTT